MGGYSVVKVHSGFLPSTMHRSHEAVKSGNKKPRGRGGGHIQTKIRWVSYIYRLGLLMMLCLFSYISIRIRFLFISSPQLYFFLRYKSNILLICYCSRVSKSCQDGVVMYKHKSRTPLTTSAYLSRQKQRQTQLSQATFLKSAVRNKIRHPAARQRSGTLPALQPF